jgi:hypothetical protein
VCACVRASVRACVRAFFVRACMRERKGDLQMSGLGCGVGCLFMKNTEVLDHLSCKL